MTDPVIFRLNLGERHSPLWGRLREHFLEMLGTRRLRNDAPLDVMETARLRGEIGVLKEILDLDKDRTPPIDEVVDT